MSVLSLLLNLLWIAFGGLYMAAGWILAAVIMAITIIGLPWARASFNIAIYTLLPFGQKAVSRAEYYGTEDIAPARSDLSATSYGWCSPAGGWRWGISSPPFSSPSPSSAFPSPGRIFKLAGIALWPIGKMIVPADDAPLRYDPQR